MRRSGPRATGAPTRLALAADPFGFSEIQANHILDMPLGRLTRLGRNELESESAALRKSIAELKRILAKRDVLMRVIRDDLTELRDRYQRERRTQIVADDSGTIETGSLVEDEPMVVSVTARGYLKAVAERSRAAKVATPGEHDAVAAVIETTALAAVLLFTDRGTRVPCHRPRPAARPADRSPEPLPVRRR